MKKVLFLIICICLSGGVFAKKKSKKKKNVRIIYKYKKYQKFDFAGLDIAGDSGGPGDISIGRIPPIRTRNKLPSRENFNPEIRKGIERTR